MGIVLECTNKDCKFRYPSEEDNLSVYYCPKCGEKALVAERINPGLITKYDSSQFSMEFNLILVLDNIRSAYNVGSIVRTCEGLGVKHVILCGITPTLLSSRVHKTALGACNSVKWLYQRNGVDFIQKMRSLNYQTIALENTRGSMNILDLKRSDLSERISLVIGNEKTGVDPGILKISDLILSIPMVGQKESLNVSVAAGIATFHLIYLFRT